MQQKNTFSPHFKNKLLISKYLGPYYATLIKMILRRGEFLSLASDKKQFVEITVQGQQAQRAASITKLQYLIPKHLQERGHITAIEVHETIESGSDNSPHVMVIGRAISSDNKLFTIKMNGHWPGYMLRKTKELWDRYSFFTNVAIANIAPILFGEYSSYKLTIPGKMPPREVNAMDYINELEVLLIGELSECLDKRYKDISDTKQKQLYKTAEIVSFYLLGVVLAETQKFPEPLSDDLSEWAQGFVFAKASKQ